MHIIKCTYIHTYVRTSADKGLCAWNTLINLSSCSVTTLTQASAYVPWYPTTRTYVCMYVCV